MAGANRLQAEFKNLLKREDLANFIAVPEEQNVFEWHFCIFGLKDCPYEGGIYHGRLSFPRDYPFKPPGIQMWTPNGRFKANTRICTNFSDYHPELWIPSWTVSTILVGLISFMNTDEITAGAIRTTDSQKRQYAATSLEYNFKNITKFEEIFKPYFAQIGIDPKTKLAITAQVQTQPKQPSGLTLQQLEETASKVSQDLIVIEFKLTVDAPSCISEETLQKHKHRLHIIDQVFNNENVIASKYSVLKAPEIILIQKKSGNWTTGIESLNLVLETFEQEEILKLEEQIKQDKERKEQRANAIEAKARADAAKIAIRKEQENKQMKMESTVQQPQQTSQTNVQQVDEATQKRKELAEQRMAALKAKMDSTKQKVTQPQAQQVVEKPQLVQSETAILRAQAFKSKLAATVPQPIVEVKQAQNEVLSTYEQSVLNMLYQERDQMGNLKIAGADGVVLNCHQQVLSSVSGFFQGMFEFNNQMGEVVKLAFEQNVLVNMLEFIYLGQTSVESNLLVDLLDLSHQYLMVRMKHSIELVFIQNISIDTYLDTYMVAKAFECSNIHSSLIKFGAENLQTLRLKLVISQLSTEDQKLIQSFK